MTAVAPAPAQQSTAERFVEDIGWLVAMGDHPLLIAQNLKRKPRNIARALYRAGARELAVLFERASKENPAAYNGR